MFDGQPSPHNSPEVPGPDTTGGMTVEPKVLAYAVPSWERHIDPLQGIDLTGDEHCYTIDELLDQGYCGFEIHSSIHVKAEKTCWGCMTMLGADSRVPFPQDPERAKKHARLHVGNDGMLVGFMAMQTTTTNDISYRTCPGCNWK
jgi:hypothetical protein